MAIRDLFFLDANGVVFPDFPTLLEQLKAEYRLIYGDDVYLEPDSQDGQWLSILARSMFDTMQVTALVYASFSPLSAQSEALTRNVKINGIRRLSPTFTTVDLVIIGQAGTVIIDGQVEDAVGQKFNLPETVTIPLGGEITVTATAEKLGDIAAVPNSVTRIRTPTIGWQSVNNPAAAVEGDPVETDAQLRRRQANSTLNPSQSVMEGITGSVSSIQGVQRLRGYENDLNETDDDGIPAHNIALVVEGGDATAIAETIANKKTAGTGTFGTTTVTVNDRFGIANDINFFRPIIATIGVEISLTARTGFQSTTVDLIKAAIAEYLNGLEIGDDIFVSKLFVPANLTNNAGVQGTFDVTEIRVKKDAGAFGTTNIVLLFNELAQNDGDDDTTVIVT